MDNIEALYEQMYEFENNSQLYDYRFKDTGISMWMYIRSYVIENITDRKKSHIVQNFKEYRSLVKKSTIEKYITRNPFFSRQKDLIFAFWGYDCLIQYDNGIVYDQLIMPYLRMFPDKSLTIMSGNISQQYEKKCAHPNWKMDDIFRDILKIKKYVRNNQKICLEDQNNIKSIVTFLKKNCPLQIDNDVAKSIVGTLQYFANNSKDMIKIFEKYLDVIKPKAVIICCASYPEILRTSMILACRNKKVVTAELQHGLLSRCYPWAQYGDYIIENNECNKILPDYFLLFGEYWKSQIKTSQNCDIIGYAKPIVKEDALNNDILLCAGLDLDRYRCFLDGLLIKIDKGTTVYFRLHPFWSHKKHKEIFKKYLNYSNFVFADKGDISIYLRKCRYVIVDGSTVAYEALFCGRIVFAFNGGNTRRYLGDKLKDIHVFNDIDDFMSLWNERNTFESKYHREFYDLNYKNNFLNFLKKCGINIK